VTAVATLNFCTLQTIKAVCRVFDLFIFESDKKKSFMSGYQRLYNESADDDRKALEELRRTQEELARTARELQQKVDEERRKQQQENK